MTYDRLQLAALRGRRQEALHLFESATEAAAVSGAGQLIATTHWAAAVLHNGLGEYPAALAAARQAVANGDLLREFLAGAAGARQVGEGEGDPWTMSAGQGLLVGPPQGERP